MPRLIRLYIINVAIGFGIAIAFVAALVWMDVAHLRHLVLETEKGWLAAIMMVMFNGIVFAGVQFGIVIMGMAEKDENPRGGLRQRITPTKPIPVEATASVKSRRRYRQPQAE